MAHLNDEYLFPQEQHGFLLCGIKIVLIRFLLISDNDDNPDSPTIPMRGDTSDTNLPLDSGLSPPPTSRHDPSPLQGRLQRMAPPMDRSSGRMGLRQHSRSADHWSLGESRRINSPTDSNSARMPLHSMTGRE